MENLSESQHEEYQEKLPEWEQISVCLAGERKVKSLAELYLPFPISLESEDRTTEEFKSQYEVYLSGAHYVNYTSQSVEDLVAGVFRQKPKVENVPTDLEYFNFDNFAKESVEGVTSYGRNLALVDYPSVEGEVSKAIEDQENIKAYYVLYNAEDILDWRTDRINGVDALTMVLLRENINVDTDYKDDDSTEVRYRLLELIDGIYTVTTQIEDNTTQTVTVPTDSTGATLKHIPATFIGSKNNQSTVDNSPVIGISNSNIKHYQTWAELNHIQTYMGHPMIAITGAPKGFVKEMEKNDIRINVGASNALVLEGDSANASVLAGASTGNIIHFQTLKELQISMQEQGARVKDGATSGQVESAEALEIKYSGDNSILASIAINVEIATVFVYQQLALFMGSDASRVTVELNKTFFEKKADPAIATMLSSGVATGNLPNRIYLKYLQDHNIIGADEDLETLATEARDSNPFVNTTMSTIPE